MKTFLHLFMILMFSGWSCLYSQNSHIPATSVITTQADALSSDEYPDFLSNYAKLFVHSLAQEIPLCSIPANYVPSDALMKHFPIGILKDSLFCITGFLEVETGFNTDTLKKLGISFVEGNELFSTAFIPLNALCPFLKLNGIVRFELTRRATLQLNKARPAVNAQTLLQAMNQNKEYNGEGVIIGIVDYGFDYTHPDFYDSTGTKYRISKVWEQNMIGTPPVQYNYGRELTEKNAILNAGTDTDTETHGTHVTGIAAGSGAGTEYYGFAPKAEIVIVSTTKTDVGIADGLKYIADYAQSQNKPCVINFSLGSSIGPHDGTSAFDRLCDNMKRPGLLFTGSVGNNGNRPIYLGYNFLNQNSNDTILLSGMIPDKNANQLIADIWGEPETRFSAAVILMDTITQQQLGSTPSIISGTKKVYTFQIGVDSTLAVIQMASEIGRYNQKPTIMVQVNLPSELPPSVIPVLKITSTVPTKISTWLSSGIFSALNHTSPFMDGSTTHTIDEIGGTGKSILSAGAFCTKNEWISVSGKAYDYGPEAVLGEIAYFSSVGPTADGRIKPDISCPGYGVVSAFSHYFNGNYPPSYYRVEMIPFLNNKYYMGILQGTSGAAPIIAGTVALWLQQKPDLTFEEAQQIIRKTAIPTNNSLPDNHWGWGILNAAKGMEMLNEN